MTYPETDHHSSGKTGCGCLKRTYGLAAFLLVLTMLLSLSACGGGAKSVYKVLDTMDSEQLRVAFRSGDGLCEFISAAMSELAAAGELSRLSAKWLGKDHACLEGAPDALAQLGTEIPENRLLLVGIESGAEPMSAYSGGRFTGLIPELVGLVCEKLGWDYKFIIIVNSEVKVELTSGNVDCAWISSSFAEESESCSLSPAYLENSHLLVVRRDTGISRKGKLNGKDIAVTDDSGAVRALEAEGLPSGGGAVWTYSDVRSCFEALNEGVCAALAVDSLVADYYIYGSGQTESSESPQ
jgi:ABC-type amino acid transport substrate-binding protein